MGGLTAFRLIDIPLDVRLRAASRVGHADGSAFKGDDKPEDRLFARLADLTADEKPVEKYNRVARYPSDRVYWISTKAWERVMGAA